MDTRKQSLNILKTSLRAKKEKMDMTSSQMAGQMSRLGCQRQPPSDHCPCDTAAGVPMMTMGISVAECHREVRGGG